VDRYEVRRLRLHLGLTQLTLAERIGVHPLTVSRWERGVVHIPEPTAQLLRLLVQMEKQKKDKR
jgi:transcriptional regulator with XRE-family HTH domain